jgi:hypothetical protein
VAARRGEADRRKEQATLEKIVRKQDAQKRAKKSKGVDQEFKEHFEWVRDEELRDRVDVGQEELEELGELWHEHATNVKITQQMEAGRKEERHTRRELMAVEARAFKSTLTLARYHKPQSRVVKVVPAPPPRSKYDFMPAPAAGTAAWDSDNVASTRGDSTKAKSRSRKHQAAPPPPPKNRSSPRASTRGNTNVAAPEDKPASSRASSRATPPAADDSQTAADEPQKAEAQEADAAAAESSEGELSPIASSRHDSPRANDDGPRANDSPRANDNSGDDAAKSTSRRSSSDSRRSDSRRSASRSRSPSADEAPKAESPKAESPKAESPKAESPKAESPKAESPKAESPKAVDDSGGQIEREETTATENYSDDSSS